MVPLESNLDADFARASLQREPLVLHLLIPARLELNIAQEHVLTRTLAIHYVAGLVESSHGLWIGNTDVKRQLDTRNPRDIAIMKL